MFSATFGKPLVEAPSMEDMVGRARKSNGEHRYVLLSQRTWNFYAEALQSEFNGVYGREGDMYRIAGLLVMISSKSNSLHFQLL